MLDSAAAPETSFQPSVLFHGLLVATTYFLLAESSHGLSFPGDFATIWLPAGFTLAALLSASPRRRGVVFFGTLCGNLTSDILFHDKTLSVSCGFWLANALEAIVAVFLLNRVGDSFRLDKPQGLLWFLLGTCVAATAVGASLGAAVVSLSFQESYTKNWPIWWSGDVIGMAVVFPCIWSLREFWLIGRESRRMLMPNIQAWAYFVGLMTLQIIITICIFNLQTRPLAYLALPILIWLTARFPMFGSTVGLLLTALIAVYHTASGNGVFGQIETLADRALVLQSFLLVTTALILTSMSLVRQRIRIDHQYRLAMDRLKKSLKQQTEIFDLLPISLIVADEERKITLVNTEFERMFGYTADEVMGRQTRFLCRDPNMFEVMGRECFNPEAESTNKRWEIEYQCKNGDTFPGETVGRSAIDENGKVLFNIGLVQDITSRIQQSERFRKLLESSPIAKVMIDQNGRIELINPATEQMFGYTKSELLGHEVEMLLPHAQRFIHRRQRVSYFQVTSTRPMNVGRVVSGLRKDGTEIRLEVGLVAFHVDGKEYALAAITDVTEREEREEELRRLQEKLQLMIEGGNIGLWDWDVKKGVIDFSDQWHHQLGIPPGTCSQPKDWENRVHPDDVEAAQGRVAKTFGERHVSYESTFRMRHADGSYRWMLSRGRLYLDDKNQPQNMVGTHTDITEMRNAQTQLESYLQIMGRTDGGWNWELSTDHVDYAPRFRELLGYQGNDTTAIPNTLDAFNNLIHPEDSNETWMRVREHQEGGKPFSAEFRLKTKNGGYRWFRSRGDTLFDARGKPTRMAGSIYDITTQKEFESRLLESNSDLEQFAYVASHDLKEPLRAIGGFSQLLLSRYCQVLDEDGAGYINHIVDGVDRMQNLIEDLLTFSRIGRVELSREPVDLSLVLHKLTLAMRSQLEAVQAQVQIKSLPTIDGWRGLTEQLFQNLLSNAIKFRHSERPLHLCVTSKVDEGFYEIRVQDNGIGIEPQYLDQIFTMFKRLHRREEIPGTGIGLAICQRIVHRSGGRILAESDVDSGTTIVIRLPVNTDF